MSYLDSTQQFLSTVDGVTLPGSMPFDPTWATSGGGGDNGPGGTIVNNAGQPSQGTITDPNTGQTYQIFPDPGSPGGYQIAMRDPTNPNQWVTAPYNAAGGNLNQSGNAFTQSAPSGPDPYGIAAMAALAGVGGYGALNGIGMTGAGANVPLTAAEIGAPADAAITPGAMAASTPLTAAEMGTGAGAAGAAGATAAGAGAGAAGTTMGSVLAGLPAGTIPALISGAAGLYGANQAKDAAGQLEKGITNAQNFITGSIPQQTDAITQGATAGEGSISQYLDKALNTLKYGYDTGMGDLTKFLGPWAQEGMLAGDLYGRGLGVGGTVDPSVVSNMPGYKFGLDQGTGAIENSAAARGMQLSGNTLKSLDQYGTDYANTKYMDWLNSLLPLTNMGYGASSSIGGQGASLAGNLATSGANATSLAGSNIGSMQNQTGINLANVYGGAANNLANLAVGQGNAAASGTVGSANAINSGISNAINAYLMNQILQPHG